MSSVTKEIARMSFRVMSGEKKHMSATTKMKKIIKYAFIPKSEKSVCAKIAPTTPPELAIFSKLLEKRVKSVGSLL